MISKRFEQLTVRGYLYYNFVVANGFDASSVHFLLTFLLLTRHMFPRPYRRVSSILRSYFLTLDSFNEIFRFHSSVGLSVSLLLALYLVYSSSSAAHFSPYGMFC